MTTREKIILAILAVVLISLSYWASYKFAWSVNDQTADFTPIWNASRLAFEGHNPYSDYVAEQNQLYVHRGRLAPEGADPARFAYPLTIQLLLFPFWFASLHYAFAAWGTVNIIAALIFGILLKETYKTELSGLALVGMVFSIVVFRQTGDVWVLGQFTLIPSFAAAVALFASTRGYKTLFIIALCYVAIRPEGALLVPLFIVLLGGQTWKTRIMAGLQFALLFTVIAILVQIPVREGNFWPLEFIAAIRKYSGYGSTLWLPSLWGDAMILPILALVGLLTLLFIKRFKSPHFYIAGSILLMLVLIPQTNLYTLVWLLVPLTIFYLHTPSWRKLFFVGLLMSSYMPFFIADGTATRLIFPIVTGIFAILFTNETETTSNLAVNN